MTVPLRAADGKPEPRSAVSPIRLDHGDSALMIDVQLPRKGAGASAAESNSIEQVETAKIRHFGSERASFLMAKGDKASTKYGPASRADDQSLGTVKKTDHYKLRNPGGPPIMLTDDLMRIRETETANPSRGSKAEL